MGSTATQGRGKDVIRINGCGPLRIEKTGSLPRRAWIAAGVALVLSLSALGNSQPAARAAGCANEAIRAEQGAAAMALPDCRAYELVSPNSTPNVSSVGLEVQGAPQGLIGMRAADDGNAMAYLSWYPFQGATSSGFLFRARRGVSGWTLESMIPQVLPDAASFICRQELNYSEDLMASVMQVGRDIKEELPKESFCGQPQEPVVPGESRGLANLFRRPTPDAPFEWVNAAPPTATPANAYFQDASADLSHIVFGEDSELTPEAPPGYNLYLWSGGMLRLVSILPDGTAARGDLAGATAHRVAEVVEEGGAFNGTAPITHAVSDNGERIFFYAHGNLYLRENAGQPPAVNPNCVISAADEPGLACTLQIDAPSLTSDPAGGGIFQYASVDGARAFFTDDHRLTPSSTASPGKPDLYEYDIEAHTLVDRTIAVAGSANVLGFSGAADDGSRVYLVARGVLAGSAPNEEGEVPVANQPNLYLLETGTVSFVAVLASDTEIDRSAWGYEFAPQAAGPPIGTHDVPLATRTSPDGRYFAFNSKRGLAGGPAGVSEIYLYDAASRSLTCASCVVGGSGPQEWSNLPVPIATAEREAAVRLPRGLTDEGQLFFTTNAALSPGDTNGVADVYEYDAGELRLISDGHGAGASVFLEAGLGGDDIFFATADPLVRSDIDNAMNIYDARVGGGFAEPPPPPPLCAAAESCHGANAGQPASGVPATTNPGVSGNGGPPKGCRRNQGKRHKRCVKRHRRHHRGRHHKPGRHGRSKKPKHQGDKRGARR